MKLSQKGIGYTHNGRIHDVRARITEVKFNFMRTVRLAALIVLLSLGAVAQESQVYLEQFSQLRTRADSMFKELSERDADKQYSSTEEMMKKMLTEPSNQLLALSRSIETLNETILKSWSNSYGKKSRGGEMVKFEFLMYACSSLSLKLDALQRFVGLFGANRSWLDLATFQDLAINSALKSLSRVTP